MSNKREQEAKEIELKLDFDPADASRILSHPALEASTGPETKELISIYYDTDDAALRNAGVFLRVRSSGEGYVQTIKAARDEAELLERHEWERTLSSHEPDLDAAEGTALAPLLTPDVRAALHPRFHTRFRRTTHQIKRDGTEIELAVDQGEITAGVEAAPISEIELELKAGKKQALFDLARDLAATVPLILGVKTKAERGFELLGEEPSAAEKAGHVDITPDMTCADAVRTIAHACIRQIVTNALAIRDGDGEALHQTRVGLRRLRAGISLFADVVSDQDCDRIKGELRWIGKELGPARDLDVFASDVLEPLRAAHPDDADVAATHRNFIERRAAAYARAAGAVDSNRFRMALIDLTAWIETGAWVDGEPASRSAIEHATKDLKRLRRKVKKRGADLRDLSTAERHKVRIRAKRLRYATEFFAATFPGEESDKRREKSLKALKDLQDALGLLNDIATRKNLLAEGEESAPPRTPGADAEEAEKQLKAAERAYSRFAKVKPFWKA